MDFSSFHAGGGSVSYRFDQNSCILVRIEFDSLAGRGPFGPISFQK